VVLVDTNVVAYLLIEGDHTAAAQRLRQRDSDWRSEAFVMVEFTNVLAASVAAKRMSLTLAQRFLLDAHSLFDGKLARLPHGPILATAAQYRVSAYDARFLTLAQHVGLRLVTEDAKLRLAAPALTQSLAEAVAAATIRQQ
jgi:predicted nucleic acid-binding protein